MTKITEKGVLCTHTTKRLSFNVKDNDKLTPDNIQFTFEYLRPLNSHMTIGGLDIDEWFKSIFEHKVITTDASTNDEGHLIVQDLDKESITNTLYYILTKIIQEPFQVVSLGWK